jgi:putative SOS response-associated peptidase YedK
LTQRSNRKLTPPRLLTTPPAVSRKAFAKRWCLIAVDGFFEWKAAGKKKQPHAIAMPDGRPFALAGL